MPLLAMLCVLSFSPNAHADDALEEVLTVMVKYGGLDPAIMDAREMLTCLVDHNGDATACFNIPTEAEKQAGKAAGTFMPDDPKVQGVINIVFAVQKEQWLKVIEIAGLKVMAPMICENAARVGGPVGSWFCSVPFKKVVANYAQPVVEEAFSLINNGGLDLGSLFELVTMLADLDLACALVPNEIYGVSEACSLLGQIISEIGGVFVDAAKYGAKIVVDGADAVENLIFGDDSHMPYDRYYGLYWLPWLHKSVNLCVTNNCVGTGNLNGRIWDDCVDYFDEHNQYRSTAKKTCSDMRDKRYIKAYELLAKAILDGARSYVGAVRAGAKAWAITEYGKNNDSAIRSHFLTLCETELEQGYPLSSGNASMCEAYNPSKAHFGPGFIQDLVKQASEQVYQGCLSQVAAQQVVPTAWRNACKKAEPEFVVMLQAEKQALQDNLVNLVGEGCQPTQGWNAQQGLHLQCQTYSGYDQCKQVMVVGANSICNVDRSMADAARAKEILGFLGETRCSLSGNEILCGRPWKHAQCQQLIKGTPSIQLSKTALSCKEDSSEYYKIAFANQALLEDLNHPIARSGQGPGCSWIEDKAKIKCLRVDNLENRLAARPEFQRSVCEPDPDYDGSDVSCYLKPYNKKTAPQQNSVSASGAAATTIQQPDGRVVRDTPLQASDGAAMQSVPSMTTMSGGLPASQPAPAAVATVMQSPATTPAVTGQLVPERREPAAQVAPASTARAVALPSRPPAPDQPASAAPDQMDTQTMLQTVRKESALEASDNLQGYSDEVKHTNEKKEEIRDELNGQVRSATAAREPYPQPAPGIGNQSVAMPNASAPGTEAARTAAPAIRAMNAGQADTAAPPSPCRAEVTYYVPEAPVLVTSGAALQVNDQLQIKCAFRKVTRNMEWQNCDAAAQSAIQILKLGQESGSRYSGIVSIDDGTVGVSTSPEDGSDFENLKLWKFDAPGTHEVSCQIDNTFRFVTEDEEIYLKAAVSVDVGARSDGLTYRGFEPANAVSIRVRPAPSEANPRLRGLTVESLTPAARQPGGNDMVNPTLNPQPEVPSSKRAGGNDMVNPSLNPQPEVPSSKRAGGGDMVNPSLNPQPEVPSARQVGGSDMINPSLNPQPEVPSAKQPGSDEMINPSLNPQPEVPSSKRAGGDDMVNPSLNPQPEVPSSKRVGGDDMVNPALNPQPEVPSRRLDPDGATMMPAPLPDPPSPNLGNNAPDNFTGAAQQDLNRTFDPQKEFAAVRLSQGSAAMSNDLNDAAKGRTNAPLVAAVHVIEAESLIATASASGGQMVRQEMAGFGAGWGGNAQLFWRPPAPAGSKPHLLTEFVLASAGTYDLMLYYTTAPDFGQFTVYIDGTNSTKHDGYGSQVGLRQALLGRYQLASGRHELAFEVTGKNQQSTGYIVGVDRMQLTSVP